MIEGLLLTLLGPVLGIPAELVRAAAARAVDAANSKWRVSQAVRAVLKDLGDPARLGTYRLTIPDGVAPDQAWQDGLAKAFSDTDALQELADMWERDETGDATTEIYRRLSRRIESAIDPNDRLYTDANRAATAAVILVLMGRHLNSGLFNPYLDLARQAHEGQLLTADAVQARLERAADAADVDVYLHKLIDFTNTDLLGRLGLDSEADNVNCRLDVAALDGEIERIIAADDILDHFSEVLVIGEPGAGKTWLSHRLVRRAAEQCQQQRRSAVPLEELRIPILARCAEIEGSTDLYSTLVEPTRAAWPERSRAERLLRKADQSVLFVFDSYDESSGSDRIREHIATCRRRPATQLVVTSRPNHVPSEIAISFRHDVDPKAATVTLRPMTREQSERLVTRLSRQTGVEPQQVLDLVGDVREDLIRNPLLATISVLAVSEPATNPIRSVPELYNAAVRQLLRREARSPRGDHQPLSEHEVDDMMDGWLESAQELAWGSQQVLDPSQRRRLTDGIRRRDFGRACEASGFEREHERVAKALFTSDHEQYHFLHRTIHEHLVAGSAARHFDAGVQRMLEFWPDWNEIGPSTILQLPQPEAFLDTWFRAVTPGSAADLGGQRLVMVRRLADQTHRGFWTDRCIPALETLLQRLPIEPPAGVGTTPAIAHLLCADQRSLAVSSLVDALQFLSTGWYTDVVDTLAEVGGEHERSIMVDQLRGLLIEGVDGHVVVSLASALSRVGSESDGAVIRDALERAVQAGADDPRAIEMLAVLGTTEQRSFAFEAFAEAVASSPDLSDRFLDTFSSGRERERALEFLVRCLDANRDHELAYAHADALLEADSDAYRDQAIATILHSLGRSSDRWVSRLVARTLIRADARDRESLEALRSMLDDHPHIEVVAGALVELGGEEYRDDATRALKDWLGRRPDDHAVARVAALLSELGGAAERQAALDALNDIITSIPAHGSLADIAQALVDIGGHEFEAAAIKALENAPKSHPDSAGIATTLNRISNGEQADAAADRLSDDAADFYEASARAEIGGVKACFQLVGSYPEKLGRCLLNTATKLPPDEWDQLLKDLRQRVTTDSSR